MVGDARAAVVHGEAILDEIVVSTDFNNLGVDDKDVPFGPENLAIELRPKEKRILPTYQSWFLTTTILSWISHYLWRHQAPRVGVSP